MTLFWHNHFATSITKIQDARLMQEQNDLLRKHALGKFGPFLREISRDPAMLIWLDSNQNVKAHPNENYAREVMELFSLGVGNYTEKDVQEAARAFTGWHVSTPADGERHFVFKKAEHDFGRKTILGQTGEWDGDDVIRILLEQKACPRFLVRKLYNFLVNENVAPPDAFIQPLCDELRTNDYDIAVPVKTILKSRHFFSAHAYRQKVKSPIDYVMGVARMFGRGPTGILVITPYHLLHTLELQGQQLYQPPNVKGWEGGKSWLNTATALARHNFAYQMATGAREFGIETARLTGAPFVVSVNPLPSILDAVRNAEGIKDPLSLLPPKKVVDHMSELTLSGDLPTTMRDKLVAHIADTTKFDQFMERSRDVLFSLLASPEYQLC